MAIAVEHPDAALGPDDHPLIAPAPRAHLLMRLVDGMADAGALLASAVESGGAVEAASRRFRARIAWAWWAGTGDRR